MSTFPPNIICETSTVQDGNMDFRFGTHDEVITNRTSFLEKHGSTYSKHIAMRCDHGEIISLVDVNTPSVGSTSYETQIHSEVLITQTKNLALMLFTADCQPVSFYDPVTETIALAHISRKTLAQHLSEKTLQCMKNELSVDSRNLHVHIGPHIKKESYAFLLPLTEESEILKRFTEEKNGFAHIDLVSAHLEQLTTLGVTLENITVSDIDTGTSPNHFSYYMMKKHGEENEARMATILMMR